MPSHWSHNKLNKQIKHHNQEKNMKNQKKTEPGGGTKQIRNKQRRLDYKTKN